MLQGATIETKDSHEKCAGTPNDNSSPESTMAVCEVRERKAIIVDRGFINYQINGFHGKVWHATTLYSREG